MTFRSTPRMQLLCLAVLATLAGVQSSAAADGQQLADGIAMNPPGGAYETDEAGSLGHGFFARNGGSIVPAGPVRITTRGAQADSLNATGPGSFITISDATLINGGEHGSGARADFGGNISLVNATIETRGTWSHGAHAERGGTLQLAGSSILVDGVASRGLYAEERDSQIRFSGGTITALQTESRGLDVSGINSLIVVDNSGITTYGMHGDGAWLGRDGRLQMNTVNIRTYGEAAYGINLNGRGAVAELDGVFIRTTGIQSKGVWALIDGRLSLRNSRIETDGLQALGIDNRGSIIDLHNSVILTRGDSAHGLYASQEYSTDALNDAYNVSVTTHGFGAFGAFSRRGAQIRLNGSTVHTTGTQASALLSMGAGSRLQVADSHILTEGDLAHAGDVRGGGSLQVAGSSLLAKGALAAALHADGGTVADPNRIRISGSQLVAEQMPAVEIQGGATELELRGSEVRGAGGVAIRVTDMRDDAGGVIDPLSVAGIDIYGGLIDGDIFNDSSGQLNLLLAEGAQWQGRSQGAHLRMQGSHWVMTGDSSLESLALGNGQISWGNDSSRQVFHTLTVNGDYSSNGGVLALSGALGGDDSPHDLLHVRGDTAGDTGLIVNNLGGRGGQTDAGFRIIQVDGRSQGVFDLRGRAVGGIYEYFLYQGSKTDPDDGHWYLRSELASVPDPCETDGTLPQCVVPPTPELCELQPSLPQCQPRPEPRPVLRPEPGAYLANQSAAVQMFQHAYQDRRSGADRRGTWVRSSRRQADFGVNDGQLDVNADTTVLQIGSDLLSLAGERLHIGVMGGHGTATTTVTSQLTGYSAKGKVEGTTLGAYASWLQHPQQGRGLYLDAWLQYGHFRNSVHGDALVAERYRSNLIATSFEAGYALRVVDTERTVVAIEPQMQISHRRYGSRWFAESNGTVIDRAQADGFSSRLGVRLSGSANNAQGNRVQPFIGVHWLRESSANRLRVDGETVSGGLPRERVEARGGAELRLGQRWSAWGDMGLQWGGRGYREVAGQIGMRAHW